MKEQDAYIKLIEKGVHPSAQRLAIMQYLMSHFTHPTVDEVFQDLTKKIPTLSRTTVYNTLRLFSEHNAAQMITIDDHHVCYDGNTNPHAHFYCKSCGKVVDMHEEEVPYLSKPKMMNGKIVDEIQVYYKGICNDCMSREKNK